MRGELWISRSIGSCESHLHSGTHRCQGIHLREAHRLAVHRRGLLHHNGGAGLALRAGRGRRVGRLGLQPVRDRARHKREYDCSLIIIKHNIHSMEKLKFF